MNTFYHCHSSVAKWGGKPEDYQAIHDFIDSSKAAMPDVRHRAVYHHALGIFLVEKIFGPAIVNSSGRGVPVREVAERHIIEDLGFIPTVEDWLKCMPLTLTKWAGGHINFLLRNDVSVPRHIVEKVKGYK